MQSPAQRTGYESTTPAFVTVAPAGTITKNTATLVTPSLGMVTVSVMVTSALPRCATLT